MTLDPCSDGCLNHNIPSNTTPSGNDDPCNTAGNGFFCTGSYWLYDPGEAGSNPAVDGDCQRLFVRGGGTCTVDQWVELSLAELVTDTVDPVSGTDCCPTGTIWLNTSSGSRFISVNDLTGGAPGTCDWCEICTDTHTSQAASVVAPDTIFDDLDANPATDIPGLGTSTPFSAASIVFTNPSSIRSMACQVVWQSYTVTYNFSRTGGGITCEMGVLPYYKIDGVTQNSPVNQDSVYGDAGMGAVKHAPSYTGGSWTQTLTLAPSASVTVSIEAATLVNVVHNADLAATVAVEQANISILGTTI